MRTCRFVFVGFLGLFTLGCTQANPASDPLVKVPKNEIANVAEFVLPPEAKDWDFIGAFRLRVNGTRREVKVYCHDSKSVARKEMARTGYYDRNIPDSLSLYVFYQ